MSAAHRTIRLFVSSTFSDFKAERDLLQREVFPKLQRLCLSKGLRFQAIDLRWGVPEEAGKDNRTMRICLRELKRCQEGRIKPNFLVLLGDRYGWRPLPETIPTEVFEGLERELTTKSVKNAEILDAWYRRDDNAVPAEYVLQPRTGRFEDFAVWQAEVEMPLLAALAQCSVTCGTAAREDRQASNACCTAIGLSATHQEIIHGALALPGTDARQHVHAFRRRIVNPPSTPHPAFTDCMPDDTPDTDSRRRLDVLCADLDDHLGPANVHPYEVPWRDEGAFNDADLAAFATEVYGRLCQVLETQIAGLEEVPPEELEEAAHRDFAEERRAGFIGRAEPLRRIREYLASGPDQPLAIVGPAGSGKSALMAQAIAECRGEAKGETQTTDHHPQVLSRFIGVTPGSSDLIELLRDLVARIRALYPRQVEQIGTGVPPVDSGPSREPKEKEPDEREIPTEINPLTNAFHEALGRATAERPIRLFLDALDQFRDANLAASLSWLPQKLPPYVRIVVSAAEPRTAGATSPLANNQSSGSEGPDEAGALTAGAMNPLPHENSSPIGPAVLADPRATISRNLARLAPGAQTVRLDPLAPADGAALLDRWLDAAGRTLDHDAQRRPILDAFAVEGNALWLRVAAEEAARWPAWHKPHPLPSGLPDLLATVLQRLSRGGEHGEVIVKRALGYLAAARHGLAEDEVIAVLGADPVVMADVIARSPTERVKPEAERIKALPVAIWVRLHGDIAFYLTERRNQGASLFGFYHRSFGEAVQTYCLPDAVSRLPLHETMAGWFDGQPWLLPPSVEDGQSARAPERSDPANSRKTSELPFHLHRVAELTPGADRWDPLVDVLCDLDCVETKARSGLIYELMTDYNAALAALPEFREENERLAKRDAAMFAFNQALRDYAFVRCDWWFAKERGETRPEPPYPPLPGALRDEAQHAIPEESSLRAARLRHFANFVSGHLAPLSQFPKDVLPLAFNWADTGPVAVQAEILLPGRKLPWLKRTPQPPARPLRPQCLRTLEGNADQVNCVSVNPDGRRAVSGSNDKTLRVWDLETGACLRTLEGHRDWVNSVSVSPDGRRAVSGSADKTLRVWDLETGACLRTLEGHAHTVNSVSVSPDGRRAVSASFDKTLRVWDLETGQCLATLEGHAEWVWSVSVSPDGRRAVSGAGTLSRRDNTLRVWDLETGACLRTLEGHRIFVNSVSVSPDGRRAVSASADRTLRVWDLETGQCLRTLEGNADQVNCVSVNPDGRRAVSGSNDKTLRVWDLETGACLRTLEGHADYVNCVSVSPDGRRAVSASWDKTLRVWDLETGACLRTLEVHADQVNCVSVSPDGRRAVSGGYDKTLRVWDLETCTCLRTLKGHRSFVNRLSVSPDGRLAVSSSFDNTLRVWDLETGACLRTLEVHAGSFGYVSVSVSPDGRRAVSASWDKTLRVWSLETGACLRTLEGHADYVKCVSVSPDGRRAVSGSTDKTLRVWDLETDACLRTLEVHADQVNCVSVNPDGRRAVSGSNDKTLRVWDLETGACLRTLEGHRDWVESVSVSPDGRRAVSGSNDQTLRVWDLETGACLAVYHAGFDIRFVVFSPSVKRIICRTGDGQMHFLTPVNFQPSRPSIITPARLWMFGEVRRQAEGTSVATPDRWDDHLTCRCLHCGKLFEPPEPVVEIGMEGAQEIRKGLWLPDSAYENPRLLAPCPHCHGALKFNPFVVDSAQ